MILFRIFSVTLTTTVSQGTRISLLLLGRRRQISSTGILSLSHLTSGDVHFLQSFSDNDVVNNISKSKSTNNNASFNLSRSISKMTRKSSTHYYDVLGVNPNATQSQIKTAYYKLSKLHHPDVTECNKSHFLFTEINEAYEILGNLRKRRMYDRGLFNPRGASTSRDDDFMDEEAKDYTQAYRKSSNFERGSRPPPPTGHSKIYNFDEFYRQHYNEMRERRSTEYKEFIIHRHMRDNYSSNKNSELRILILLALIILSGFVVLLERNYDKDHILGSLKNSNSTNGHYLSPNSISATASKSQD